MSEFTYVVINPNGRRVMSTTTPSCRYSKATEEQMLSAGFKILVNGKKLTVKELKGK